MIAALLFPFIATEGHPEMMWAIAAHGSAMPKLLTSGKPLSRGRIERVFRGLGYEEYRCSVAPVAGSGGSYVVSLAGYNWGTYTFWVDSRRMERIALDTEEDGEGSCLVDRARFSNGVLLLGGCVGWYGNGARYALQTFRQPRGSWRRTSRAHTEDECWGGDPFPKPSGGRMVVTLVSRTYPDHLNCSHATAMLTHDESFLVRDGVVKKLGKRRRQTAFNTLDDLSGALAKGDQAKVRRIVTSPQLRKAAFAAWKRLGPGPSINSPRSVNRVDGTVYAWEKGSKKPVWFHFAKRSGSWVVVRITESA